MKRRKLSEKNLKDGKSEFVVAMIVYYYERFCVNLLGSCEKYGACKGALK